MKKGLAVLLIILLSINFACADIRINEVELNPAGDDNKNEWIELYSQTQVNLINWTILSSNGRNISFNASFEGYYIITTPYNFLTNKDNALTLKNDFGVVIDWVKSLTDNNNNDYSWQYCLENWTFTNSSKGQDNNCYKSQRSNTTANNINITNSQNKTAYNDTIKTANKTTAKITTNELIINDESQSGLNQDSPEVIILGKSSNTYKKIPQIENSIIYKSKNEYIKEYIPYAFSLLCILLMALLAIDRNKTKIRKDND